MQLRNDHPSHHIVVHDPEDQFWEGALIETEAAAGLRARGVVTLPIAPAIVTRSAVSGYFRRSWGSGWPLGGTVPKRICPMMLYVMRGVEPASAVGLRTINWAARLVPENEQVKAQLEGGMKLTGTVQLVADSGQPGASSGGFGATPETAVQMNKMGPMDLFDGWTIYGRGTINTPSDMLFSCALYGAVLGVKVSWAAVSQSI
jgi:hypothetical protein